MINRTFEGPQDADYGYLINSNFIRFDLKLEIEKYNSQSRDEITLFAMRENSKMNISLNNFIDDANLENPIAPLDTWAPDDILKDRLRKIVKIDTDFYSEFDEFELADLDQSREYFVLSGLNPVLFMRTEFGSDACGFIIRDKLNKYNGQLEHWVDYHGVNEGIPWTAHLKFLGENPSNIIKKLYEHVLRHYAPSKEK